MHWTNFHTHTDYSDGEGTPRDFADEAVRQGVKVLGFSCHAPVPFPVSWAMKSSDLREYRESVRSLKTRYEGKLRIYLGLEIDFIPEVTGPSFPQFQSLALDYTIGAVHFAGRHGEGKYWGIDASEEEFAWGIDRLYGGSAEEAVKCYYRMIRAMIQGSRPDITAHLDLIKKNNKGGKYFSEEERWYREEVFETVRAIAASGSILEINTGSLSRHQMDSPYPSPWILERCFEEDIPITLCSDAHKPQDLTGAFRETAALLRDIGFKTLHVLGPRGWSPLPFSPEGLETAPEA